MSRPVTSPAARAKKSWKNIGRDVMTASVDYCGRYSVEEAFADPLQVPVCLLREPRTRTGSRERLPEDVYSFSVLAFSHSRN